MRHEMIKSLSFDYGHRILRHEGRCKRLHGHRGTVEIACSSDTLDEAGRVIDFGVVKQVVGGWIDEALDHRTILQRGDTLIPVIEAEPDDMPHVVEFPPTAEELARYVFRMAVYLLGTHGVRVEWVRFYETPSGSAIWRREPTFDIGPRQVRDPHTSSEAREP